MSKKSKLFPAKCLVDSKTGKPIMLPHGNNKRSRTIRKTARESAQNLLNALADPNPFRPI